MMLTLASTASRLRQWAAPAPVRASLIALALQFFVVLWICLRGYYDGDDLTLQVEATRHGWFDPAYLTMPWAGHFMPGSLVFVQIVSRLFTFQYEVVALTCALAWLAAGIALLKLFVTAFGPRRRIFWMIMGFVVSMAAIQAATWWSAAINMLPLLCCMSLALDAQLRWLRDRLPRQAAMAVGYFGAGLLFMEKGLLVGSSIFLLSLALNPTRNPLRAALETLIRSRWQWLTMIVIGGAYLLVYRASEAGADAQVPPAGVWREWFANGVTTIATATVGGPLRWNAASGAIPPTWLVVLAVGLLSCAIAVTLSRGTRARRIWLMPLFYVAVTSVITALGRAFAFGSGPAQLPRYYADTVLLLIFSIGIASTRLTQDPWPGSVRELTLPRMRSVDAATKVGLNVAVLASLFSVIELSNLVAHNDGRQYFLAATTNLRAHDPSKPILNAPIDPAFYYAWNRLSWLDPTFNGITAPDTFPEATNSPLQIIDTGGRIVAGKVTGVGAVRPARIDTPAKRIPLKQTSVLWGPVISVSYHAERSGTLSIQMATAASPTLVPVISGNNVVTANINGGGRYVSMASTEGPVTVKSLTVGYAEPAN